MGVYIRTDIRRLSFRELWGISSRIPVFLTGCVMKVLGLRGPLRLAVLHEDVIRVIPPEHASAAALRALGPVVEEFQRAGASLAFYHAVSGTAPLEGCAAVLLHPERDAVISVTWARSSASGPGTKANGVITSQFRDGTFLSTTGARRQFDPPPGVQVFRHRNAPPSELMRRHKEHLAGIVLAPLPVEHAGQAEQLLLSAKRNNFESKVRRGVWVPLTREERVRLGLPVE